MDTQESNLNNLRRQIAQFAIGGMDVHTVIEALESTQWETWIDEAKDRTWPIVACTQCHHNMLIDIEKARTGDVYGPQLFCEKCKIERRDERNTRLAIVFACLACGGSHTYSEMAEVTIPTQTPRHTAKTRACPVETEKDIDRYKTICIACDKRYLPFYSKQICEECQSSPVNLEMSRVYNHNKRAKELGLPATLTLKEWLSTLAYFQWKCAYCLAPFTSLEHYTPLSLGIGSTINNCLPSCKHCNNRKRDKHPDDFARLFPVDNLARIRAYLASIIANEGVKQSE